MAVNLTTSTGRRTNQFYEVTNVQGQDACILLGDKDSISIPCDSNGSNPVYTNATISFKVYEGSVDSTNSWTTSVYVTQHITGGLSSNIYTITALSSDLGYVTIRASKSGFDSLYRKINVAKVKAGVAGSDSPFIYIAYADDKDGTGFTLTYTEKEYFGILISVPEVVSPDASDFVGLWQPFYNYPNTSRYNNVAYLPTTKCHWNGNAMGHASMSPGSWHYKGTYNRVYFVFYEYYYDATGTTTRAGHLNSAQVGYYDLDGRYFSSLTTIANVYNTSKDQHDIPIIIVSDDGHIIVVKEQLRNAGSPAGAHNSPIEIWRSDEVEDISAFTTVATISDPITIGYAYPNMTLGPNSGEIYLFLRGDEGVDHSHIHCIRSLDNGGTWASLAGTSNNTTEIASCYNIIGSDIDWYFYLKVLNGKRENGLNIVGSICEQAAVNNLPTGPDGTIVASRYKILVYLHSDDGITWENIKSYKGTTGTFSKNIVTTGFITPSELYSNFVIDSCTSIARLSFAVFDAAIDTDGNPYIFDKLFYRWATIESPDYAGKDNIVLDDRLRTFNVASNSWEYVSIATLFRDPYDIDPTQYSLSGSRYAAIVYASGMIDIVGRRLVRKTNRFKPDYTAISSSSNAIRGGVYRINTTESNNFGEGVIVGDNFLYSSTETINGSNTFLPLEQEFVAFRSQDKGVTWTELKLPVNLLEDMYATASPATIPVGNYQESGIIGMFMGIVKALNGVAAYDHTELYLFWDQIKI